MKFSMQDIISKRLGGINFGKEDKIYKFEKIKIAKREAIKKFPKKELIDLGVGEPDERADDSIINALKEEVVKKSSRFYADNGIDEFKNAASTYMKDRFGVTLDPDKEINHSIGSKSALALLPYTLVNPGDFTLMTVPGYPVTGTITQYLGGHVFNLPLTPKNSFLPDLDSIPEDVLKKTKILYLNYPNNPTGQLAPKKFFNKVVSFAKENNIAVIQDAAYIELTYGEKQESFLSVPGAKDVGVEIHSLSKSFNMTGWRIAFVCGNELIIKAFATVKDNNDSGQFVPIQKAAVYALKHPELIDATRKKYNRRLIALTNILTGLGFSVTGSKGTFFLYFEIPKGTSNGRHFNNAGDFCDFLIREKLISSVPWDDAGHFLRFSATFEAENEQEETNILKEIENRLSEENFIFE